MPPRSPAAPPARHFGRNVHAPHNAGNALVRPLAVPFLVNTPCSPSSGSSVTPSSASREPNGVPPTRSPLRLLCASAAAVLSLTRSCSNSAGTASIRNTIFPLALLVSIFSLKLTRSAPALSSRSAMSIASRVRRRRPNPKSAGGPLTAED